MSHPGHREATWVPLAHRRWLLDHFTKADLAELAWDYARQLIGGDEALDGDVAQDLVHRRDLLTRARTGARRTEAGR